MPAFAEEHGARELGGVALACFAAGSLVGGLLAGMRPARERPPPVRRRRFRRSRRRCSRSSSPSRSRRCAPRVRRRAADRADGRRALHAIDRTARAGTAAEAFAWFGTAISVGIAAGSAVAGALVDERGVRWAFALGAASRSSAPCSAGRAEARSEPLSLTAYLLERSMLEGTERRILIRGRRSPSGCA